MWPDIIIVKIKKLLAHSWNCIFSKCYNLQIVYCYWNFLWTENLKEDRFIWAGVRRMGTCGVQVGGSRSKTQWKPKEVFGSLWAPGALSCCWPVFYGFQWFETPVLQREHVSGNLGVPNYLGAKIISSLLKNWSSESQDGWTEKVGTLLVSVSGTQEKCL